MNLNTILTPVYWELMEPTEGKSEVEFGIAPGGYRPDVPWVSTVKTEIGYSGEAVKYGTQPFLPVAGAELCLGNISTGESRRAQQP